MKFLVLLLILLFPSAALANTADQRAQKIFADIRCASCETQTIETSNAQVAQDMRALIIKRIAEGYSDRDIRTELRLSYGDAIFLTPPVQKNTYLLWALPFLQIIGAIFFLRSYYSKKGPA